MRLTLRTLLAWLDDTLSPNEVREIGKQVAESPFARELVERLHKVSRRRRLTVPSSNGPDGTDPNEVAAYLDNEMEPDAVAEFERKCLTSDVHLAEVACSHQILSLIGQKAKVPDVVRQRMHHLIKGRESQPPAPRTVDGHAASKMSAPVGPRPVKQPVQPWVTPLPPERPAWQRYGPVAGVCVLFLILIASAWMSLTPGGAASGPGAVAVLDAGLPQPNPAPNAGNRAVEPAPVVPAAAAIPHPDLAANAPPVAPAEVPEKPAPEAAKPDPDKADASKLPNLPQGAAAVANTEGVLLRWNNDARTWERLDDGDSVKNQERVLNLSPFRALLSWKSSRVELVSETELRVFSAAAGQAARFELVRGRVVLRDTKRGETFMVTFGTRSVRVTPSPDSPVGLEVVLSRPAGAAVGAAPRLRVYSADAEVELDAGGHKDTLASSSSILLNDAGEWTQETAQATPNWVADPSLPPFDKQIGEQFVKYFRPKRPVVADLVEAVDDEQADIRRLAIAALGAVGDLSMIVPVLNNAESAVSRRAAINVLRQYLSRSPENIKAVREQLNTEFGEDSAASYERLLIGFSPREAREEATYRSLVDQLSAAEVGLRELAIWNLEDLTGRDNLEYDAANPEGKGLKAWQDLLRNKALRPAAGVPKS